MGFAANKTIVEKSELEAGHPGLFVEKVFAPLAVKNRRWPTRSVPTAAEKLPRSTADTPTGDKVVVTLKLSEVAPTA